MTTYLQLTLCFITERMPKKKEHEVANYKFRIPVRFIAVELFQILRAFVKKQTAD